MQDWVEHALIADRSVEQSAFLVHAVSSEQQLVAMQESHEAVSQVIPPEQAAGGAPPSLADDPDPDGAGDEPEEPELPPLLELDPEASADFTHALMSPQALPRHASALPMVPSLYSLVSPRQSALSTVTPHFFLAAA